MATESPWLNTADAANYLRRAGGSCCAKFTPDGCGPLSWAGAAKFSRVEIGATSG